MTAASGEEGLVDTVKTSSYVASAFSASSQTGCRYCFSEISTSHSVQQIRGTLFFRDITDDITTEAATKC